MIPHPLACDLQKALDEGQAHTLRSATSEERREFEPRAGDCHGNVDRWILQHPEHTRAQGWLVQPGAHFIKHSVVQFEDGSLVDITLLENCPGVFIFHHEVSSLSFENMPVEICPPLPPDLKP